MWIQKRIFSINFNGDHTSFLSRVRETKNREPKAYFSKEIQRIANISSNQLKHWTISGVIEPAKPVRGTGKMHQYDHQNLIEVMVCRELNKYSINYVVMNDLIKYLRKKELKFSFTIPSYDRPDPLEIKKTLTLYEFVKIYYQSEEIFLILSQDPRLPNMTDPYEYRIDVSFSIDALTDILQICPSVVIISLSRLIEEAGGFYKEG